MKGKKKKKNKSKISSNLMHNKKEACFLRDNLKIIDDNGKIPKKE